MVRNMVRSQARTAAANGAVERRTLVRIALATGALVGAALLWASHASAHERGVVVVGGPVYAAPAPVYYAPAPTYYVPAPPPRVVYAPAPAYYRPEPVYEGLSFMFSFGGNDRREHAHWDRDHDRGRHEGWDRGHGHR
ncbi:MAG: hypothetical protein ACM30I_00895 [Gemmatimonas sp.]